MRKNTIKKIDRYYDAHKEQIYNALHDIFGDDRDYKDVFRQSVLRTRTAEKLSTDKAIKNVMQSETYIPEWERLRDNAFRGLKKDRNAYDTWRRLTQHQKIDFSRIVYEGNNRYSYITRNIRIYIDYDTSPEQVFVWSEPLT